MSCNFKIPFSGSAEQILNKAKTTVQSQGGNFSGDINSGDFDVTVFGNTIKGSYTVVGTEMNILITDKPFLIPCNTIEDFLKSQLGGV
jgi:hypothetical protein